MGLRESLTIGASSFAGYSFVMDVDFYPLIFYWILYIRFL